MQILRLDLFSRGPPPLMEKWLSVTITGPYNNRLLGNSGECIRSAIPIKIKYTPCAAPEVLFRGLAYVKTCAPHSAR